MNRAVKVSAYLRCFLGYKLGEAGELAGDVLLRILRRLLGRSQQGRKRSPLAVPCSGLGAQKPRLARHPLY
jgi:hypothetical protein